MSRRIFISAVSKELQSYRKLASESLRKRGYEPVDQEIFALTDQEIVRCEDRFRADLRGSETPAEVASLFWGGGLGEPERMDAPDHPNTQGARYVIKFVLWDQGERPRTYRQFLYPFADQGRQGMWSFTPPGQRWGGSWRVLAGWWVVSVDAEGILEAHGIPDSETQPRPSAGHRLWT